MSLADNPDKAFEKECFHCGGRGYIPTVEQLQHPERVVQYDEQNSCVACRGWGVLPNELGTAILSLIRHNTRFKPGFRSTSLPS